MNILGACAKYAAITNDNILGLLVKHALFNTMTGKQIGELASKTFDKSFGDPKAIGILSRIRSYLSNKSGKMLTRYPLIGEEYAHAQDAWEGATNTQRSLIGKVLQQQNATHLTPDVFARQKDRSRILRNLSSASLLGR